MKNITLFCLFAFGAMMAQDAKQTMLDTVTEMCGSAKLHALMLKNDKDYALKMQQFEEQLKNNPAQRLSQASYIIPVVFHIVHKGEAIGVGTNISDEAVREKLRVINESFRKVAGTGGFGNGVDTNIEFALAVRDPNGQCTNGIDRVDMSSNSAYVQFGVSNNGIPENTLKNMIYWDTHLYYNIYVISSFNGFNDGVGGLMGWAYLASSHGSFYDGSMVVSNVVRDALEHLDVHELGHGMDLYHSFEGDANGGACPITANGCGSDTGDCCADTPPHIRTGNICEAEAGGTNACNGNSPNTQFLYNYMNYGAGQECKNMFTANQKTRMISAISTVRGSLVAVNGNDKLIPVSAPTAKFMQNAQCICPGGVLKLYDISSCIPNTYLNGNSWNSVSYNWTLVNGNTTYTSILQNPALTLTIPGFYTVTLTVANAFGSSTITVPNAVMVTPSAVAGCMPVSDNDLGIGFTVNSVKFNTFESNTSLVVSHAYQDLSCVKNTIVNAGQTYQLKLSMRAGNFSALAVRVYIDYNSNGIFETGEMVYQNTIPNDTKSEVIQNVTIPLTASANKLLRMRVFSDKDAISDAKVNCAANFDTSDIKDYGVYVLNPLANPDFDLTGLQYFPNPVKEQFIVTAQIPISDVSIHTILGRQVYQSNPNSTHANIDFSGFARGVYFVSVSSQNKKSVIKVIKE